MSSFAPKSPVAITDIGAVIGFVAAVVVAVMIAKRVPIVKGLI